MTIFADDAVRQGLRDLGRSVNGKFLRQRLMEALVETEGPQITDGAARWLSGRRSFAAELIEALGFNDEAADGGRTDSGLVRRRRSTGSDHDAGRRFVVARRVPPAVDG